MFERPLNENEDFLLFSPFELLVKRVQQDIQCQVIDYQFVLLPMLCDKTYCVVRQCRKELRLSDSRQHQHQQHCLRLRMSLKKNESERDYQSNQANWDDAKKVGEESLTSEKQFLPMSCVRKTGHSNNLKTQTE